MTRSARPALARSKMGERAQGTGRGAPRSNRISSAENSVQIDDEGDFCVQLEAVDVETHEEVEITGRYPVRELQVDTTAAGAEGSMRARSGR